MIQYVIGVLMKMPFYWHLIYWFFFADVFLCFFCQYLDGMHGSSVTIRKLPISRWR